MSRVSIGMNPSRVLLPVLLAAVLFGCENTTTAPGPAARAVLRLSVTPDPLVSDIVPGGFSVRYVIKITEIAGVGGTFEFVNSTVFDDVTGRQLAVNNFDNSDMLVFVGTDRLEPNQSIDVPQTIAYITPGAGRAAVLTVAVRFDDDKDSIINESILVKIL
jgi:hypothetical protein